MAGRGQGWFGGERWEASRHCRRAPPPSQPSQPRASSALNSHPTHHAEGGVVQGGHQARVVPAVALHGRVRPGCGLVARRHQAAARGVVGHGRGARVLGARPVCRGRRGAWGGGKERQDFGRQRHRQCAPRPPQRSEHSSTQGLPSLLRSPHTSPCLPSACTHLWVRRSHRRTVASSASVMICGRGAAVGGEGSFEGLQSGASAGPGLRLSHKPKPA